jgi:hypothetical protein
MDINPFDISHIRKAFEKGLGSSEAQIVGENLEAVKRAFKRE